MRRLSQKGSTLLEVIVSTGILGLLGVLLGAGLFQMTAVTQKTGAGLQAQAGTSRVLLQLMRDVQGAQSTDLVSGAPSVGAASFSWIDETETSHTVSYAVVNGDLLRTYDGNTAAIGRQVTSFTLSRSAKLITMGFVSAPPNRFNVSVAKSVTVGLRVDG